MKAFVSILGKDKVGIIFSVTSIFKEANVNVLDVNQTIVGDYFTMIMLVDLDKTLLNFNELKNKLDNTGKELDLSIKIQREDIFTSMMAENIGATAGCLLRKAWIFMSADMVCATLK
jgi:ACT domain-containing protein